jgi:ribonucleoside-diphosphate reductase alpha chain
MIEDPLVTEISRRIWSEKYRLRHGDGSAEVSIQDSWRRVAHALASVEQNDRRRWERRFFQALDDLKVLPGGRILAGAGSGREVTLFNCFVMGMIEDSLDGIFEALKESAVTMQQGGGIGLDFSTLRPEGTLARRTGATASGPVSFMRMWDSMCATMISGGNRRGAMMATLRCDHPDIELFVQAKSDPRALRNFNLSVLVTDAFMEAVRNDQEWPLVFPAAGLGEGERYRRVDRTWSGSEGPLVCCVLRSIQARDLWDAILHAAYDYAEPGVLFVDRINGENNLAYRERISATNPCGEVPLPPYGACDLGAINLTQFVRRPFTDRASLDLARICDLTGTAVRMLDNLIDVSRYPLSHQAQIAHGTRRIGLGITGLADALIMLGLHYGEEEARQTAARAMRAICHAAYRASTKLAEEKGPFPYFQPIPYLTAPFIRGLPDDLREAIRQHGVRNSHLISIAPTGTISLLANNISSGIEPVFSFRQGRTLRLHGRNPIQVDLEDYALRLWCSQGGDPERLPPSFVEAPAMSPKEHLAMQAALQPYVDNAISKTINVPPDLTFQALRSVYEKAFEAGLKGCTVYRPNPVTGAVLIADRASTTTAGSHCCEPDREGD